VGEREELQPEGAGLGEEAQFDIPEEIQGHRECFQERDFRVGRRERGAGESEARCPHKRSEQQLV
jgi:hypothetical protein